MVRMQTGPVSIHPEPIHLQGQLLAKATLSLLQQLRHLPVLKTGSLFCPEPSIVAFCSAKAQALHLLVLIPFHPLGCPTAQTPHCAHTVSLEPFLLAVLFLMFS